MDTIPVVAAVIRRDGLYLLGRRPSSKRHGGLWEFPGGKLLNGEDLLAAARRELEEELGLVAIGTGDVLFHAADEGSPFVVHFVEVLARGEPTPTEHSEVGWFAPAELSSLELAPADARFVRQLTAET